MINESNVREIKKILKIKNLEKDLLNKILFNSLREVLEINKIYIQNNKYCKNIKLFTFYKGNMKELNLSKKTQKKVVEVFKIMACKIHGRIGDENRKKLIKKLIRTKEVLKVQVFKKEVNCLQCFNKDIGIVTLEYEKMFKPEKRKINDEILVVLHRHRLSDNKVYATLKNQNIYTSVAKKIFNNSFEKLLTYQGGKNIKIFLNKIPDREDRKSIMMIFPESIIKFIWN